MGASMHLVVTLLATAAMVVLAYYLARWEVHGTKSLRGSMTSLYQTKPRVFWCTYVGIFASMLALSVALHIYVMAVIFAAFLVFAPLAKRREHRR